MTNIVSDKGYVVDVTSTMVETIAYSASTEYLWVKFKTSGDVYEYAGVSLVDANDLRTAQSHGTFLNSNIKGTYTDRKGDIAEFNGFCDVIKHISALVPIVNIDWDAVTAVADDLVWDRY